MRCGLVKDFFPLHDPVALEKFSRNWYLNLWEAQPIGKKEFF